MTPTVDPAITDLVALARRFGTDTEFSRAGGGNVSVKVNGVLHIKPSGVPLATLTAEHLVPLRIEPLLAFLADAAAGPDTTGSDPVLRLAASARLDGLERRPSVELLFHALMTERFVVHTHPIVLNSVSCNSDGEALVTRLFGEQALWIPYTDPGLPLARAIAAARSEYTGRHGVPAPRVTILQNHGIVVTGETATEVGETSAWLMRVVTAELGRLPVPAGLPEPVEASRARSLVESLAPALRALLGEDAARGILVFDDSPLAARFTLTDAGRAFVGGGPLTPDQIVYAGSWPLVLDVAEDAGPDDVLARVLEGVEAHVAATGERPIIVIVPGIGLFAAGGTWAQADTARHIYLDALRVGEGALRLGGVRALAPAERRFIEDWEAEAYRKGVAASSAGGRVAGRVALVTGAAQGFGLALAAGLVASGAHVVLADMNAAGAASEAAALEERFGPGRAVSVAMNVTDEQSVADGVHAVIRRYGGLDILVSNAGVLRAGGVTTQPVADFDLVTKVNYRGYFLCVRSAAPVMARQHAARPGWWSDVIEINSKSGLTGSSRNSAYAGSKFGGIGLTQSFALELVGDGIKVNAICPGNFLDGPLWADPANGLFVQYLREGKVPGATTIDDVRRFYEAKVPMGRGCTPDDVLEALHYLVAQQYETGQALPVTGGQVMLS
jgi:rhamnose utilization protein RhaD (predicted bifunctional aldolase and dehydrogenase)/NAD(P)-dependent dehydrogenase (short-subunit alcohol dehydrogenase family)